MRFFRLCLTLALITTACLALAGAAAQTPFTLEQIYTPPYPFGISPRMLALSDDGAYLACGWNSAGWSCRDLWTYNVATGEWRQHTDLWPAKEARLRRDFARDLRLAREEWDTAHPKKEQQDSGKAGEQESSQQDSGVGIQDSEKDQDSSGSGGTPQVDSTATDEQQFDEAKRVEDFEKSVKQQRKDYGGVSEIVFGRGGHALYYIVEGALYSLDLDDAQAQPRERLRHEQGFGGLSRLEGSDAFLLGSDADLLLWWPDDAPDGSAGRLRQITSGAAGDLSHVAGYALSAARADSRGGRWLAYITSDSSAARKTQIPDLLAADPYMIPSQHVRPGDTPETVSLTISDLDQEPPWPGTVKLPEDPSYSVAALAWTPLSAGGGSGGDQLLLGVITSDTREYKAYLITPPKSDDEEPEIELVYREHDDKWINWERTRVDWAADGNLLLQSEREGYSALYKLVAPPSAAASNSDGSGASPGAEQNGGTAAAATQDTGGAPAPPTPAPPASALPVEDFGTRRPEPLLKLEHKEVLTFSPLRHSLRALVWLQGRDTRCATFSMLDLAGGALTPLCPDDGWRGADSTYNDDETRLAYLVCDTRHMNNLALADMAGGAVPRSAGLPVSTTGSTASLPVSADGGLEAHPTRISAPTEKIILDRTQPAWQAWADKWDVRFISAPGKNGPVPVKLYLPPHWRADGDYPLLLWAHGAGYAQTVYEQPGFLELFHPWLAREKGWIVAEVDYRGSSGYGRDWRTDVWGNLGHGEVDDLVSVKHYLMDRYGADAQRTALWGWSYGGYLTLMALGLKPGEFPVGCAVAPVTRWENYHSYFAVCRLGLPAEHPKEFERSSAETYLKDIKDQLLIVHGLRDDNTVFQSVAQYLEKSHELGVNVELDLFPSDSHGIGNEQHYIRVFEAVVDFCEAHWE